MLLTKVSNRLLFVSGEGLAPIAIVKVKAYSLFSTDPLSVNKVGWVRVRSLN